jgi:hypothetical protein
MNAEARSILSVRLHGVALNELGQENFIVCKLQRHQSIPVNCTMQQHVRVTVAAMQWNSFQRRKIRYQSELARSIPKTLLILASTELLLVGDSFPYSWI